MLLGFNSRSAVIILFLQMNYAHLYRVHCNLLLNLCLKYFLTHALVLYWSRYVVIFINTITGQSIILLYFLVLINLTIFRQIFFFNISL